MTTYQVTKYCTEADIPGISKLETIWSPEISIHGIPWKIQMKKMKRDYGHSLGVFLFCASKDKSPNWSLSGTASFKLLPFSDDGEPIVHHTTPFVFDASGVGHGTGDFVKWDELFNEAKKYVQNDTIKLEFKVTAENPNDPNRSRLNFKWIQMPCSNCHFATFRLKVTNVLNLMAVQSPQFTLGDLQWGIQIFKRRSSHLGLLLFLDKKPAKVTGKALTTIKLISSKKDVHPIEKCDTHQYQYLKNFEYLNVVSWDEMVKPENGFVTENSITLEVEIKVDDPEGDAPIAKRAKPNPENDVKSPQMECSICLKCIADQELAVTPCGHVFCSDCIKKAVTARAVCPACNKAVRLNALKQLFLPVVN